MDAKDEIYQYMYIVQHLQVKYNMAVIKYGLQ